MALSAQALEDEFARRSAITEQMHLAELSVPKHLRIGAIVDMRLPAAESVPNRLYGAEINDEGDAV